MVDFKLMMSNAIKFCAQFGNQNQRINFRAQIGENFYINMLINLNGSV